MTDYYTLLSTALSDAISALYGQNIDAEKVIVNATKKEFEGDYTIVLFPYIKQLRLPPAQLGEAIGNYIIDQNDDIESFNVVQGFLNLSFSNNYWRNALSEIASDDKYGKQASNGKRVMVEFSSPNTNKPLHLGHIRNILLGWSCSQLLDAAGYEVIKTQIVNDRGIAVCKSMLAWQLFGNGSTPQTEGVKGDHFVGKYYVLFDKKLQEEYQAWQRTDAAHALFQASEFKVGEEALFYKKFKNDYFNEYSSLGRQARDLLIAWENGQKEAIDLWQTMNSWVYGGFEETYDKLGVEFDKLYYESETYLLGKSTIEYGLKKSLFYTESDGSVWVDLEDVGYDKKILLRSDGTSVYMTQDIGTAMTRYRDYKAQRMVYVVGDEQDYHFQVLFEVLKKLAEPYADQLFHLSYGMIDLPEGRMKSREGTIVDADDLIHEVIEEARKSADERGEMAGDSPEEQEDILRKIGLAALKFFIIKVTPKKRMTFNPRESVDLQGQTGPYIQNAYVRIQSILRKNKNKSDIKGNYTLHADEKEMIRTLIDFPGLIVSAAEGLNPSEVANYMYNLAKSFHKFYHDFRIMGAESEAAKAFRIELITTIASVLKEGMRMLGIEMPERM